jgi:hypothetical protein
MKKFLHEEDLQRLNAIIDMAEAQSLISTSNILYGIVVFYVSHVRGNLIAITIAKEDPVFAFEALTELQKSEYYNSIMSIFEGKLPTGLWGVSKRFESVIKCHRYQLNGAVINKFFVIKQISRFEYAHVPKGYSMPMQHGRNYDVRSQNLQNGDGAAARVNDDAESQNLQNGDGAAARVNDDAESQNLQNGDGAAAQDDDAVEFTGVSYESPQWGDEDDTSQGTGSGFGDLVQHASQAAGAVMRTAGSFMGPAASWVATTSSAVQIASDALSQAASMTRDLRTLTGSP